MCAVWRQVAGTAGARVWSLAVSMVVLAVTARVLGAHGRGLFAAAFAWAGLFTSVLYLSLGQVALHEVSSSREDKSGHGEMLGTLRSFAAAFSVLGWALAGVLWWLTDGELFVPLSAGLLATGLLLVPLLIWEQYGSVLLSMIDRVDVYNRAVVLGRGLTLVAVVALLVAGAEVYGLLLATLLGQAWVALRGMRQLGRTGGGPRYSAQLARRLAAGGLRLHLSSIGTVMLVSADVLIVAHYSGAAAAGIYQLATQLLYGLMVVPQASTLVLYGRIAADGPAETWEVQRRVVLGVSAALLVLGAIATVTAPLVVAVVAGDGFGGSVPVFRIVVGSVLGFGLSALMAPQWIGRGLFGTASAVTLGVALVNVLGNFLVVPEHGADGAAVVLLATSGLLLLANGWLIAVCERGRPASRTPAYSVGTGP